jgi:adenylyltransferase/sulfurtransferase
MSELPLEISCQDVQTRLRAAGGDLLLLDCREPHEFNLVSIPEARLLPMSELPGRIGELAEHRARHVVVHCHLGGRSLQVTLWLRQQGFPNVQSMAGGIDQWAVEIEPGMPRY